MGLFILNQRQKRKYWLENFKEKGMEGLEQMVRLNPKDVSGDSLTTDILHLVPRNIKKLS